jgi:hypothetical protein
VRKLNQTLDVLPAARRLDRHSIERIASDDRTQFIVNPATPIRQLSPARRPDRPPLDQGQPPPNLLDDAKACSHRAGIDTENSHDVIVAMIRLRTSDESKAEC